MAEQVLIVNRWVRYGHDRLYVKAADGTEIGYRDNKSGVNHVAAGVYREALQAALAAYWAGGGKPGPEAATPAAGTRSPGHAPGALPPATLAAPEEPWTDLSLTRAGAAARDQALAKRAEAPVKSLFARVLGVHTDERAWRIGADGEVAIAAQLQRLGPAWKTLHAVPVGGHGSDIDHVLIGPGGVYTINSKHLPGSSVRVGGNVVTVNGSRTWYVRNSRHEAHRAASLLTARAGFPVHVNGLVAIICDRNRFTVKSQPPGGDVDVVAGHQVADWLSRRGTVLSPALVGAVFEVARRSTTWTG